MYEGFITGMKSAHPETFPVRNCHCFGLHEFEFLISSFVLSFFIRWKLKVKHTIITMFFPIRHCAVHMWRMGRNWE